MSVFSNAESVRLLTVTIRRLFANRQMQPWPSKVSKNEGWDDLYDTARQGIPGVRGIDDAVSWINGFIGKIDAAQN